MAALALGRGFLPAADPARALPAAFQGWEEVAAELPKLLVARQARTFIERMPLLERATHPVATNPSPVLEAIARERGWRILNLFT